MCGAGAGVNLKIRMSTDGAVIATAILDDHACARDFAAMLPLKLAFEDYAATEKIAYLPRALVTGEAPATCTPVAGDIAYYIPWGNLAVFYADGQPSQGLVRLGRLLSGLDAISGVCAGVITVALGYQ